MGSKTADYSLLFGETPAPSCLLKMFHIVRDAVSMTSEQGGDGLETDPDVILDTIAM